MPPTPARLTMSATDWLVPAICLEAFESCSAAEANFSALVDAIVKARPSGAKGKFVHKVSVSSSMGPGVKVDLGEAGA